MDTSLFPDLEPVILAGVVQRIRAYDAWSSDPVRKADERERVERNRELKAQGLKGSPPERYLTETADAYLDRMCGDDLSAWTRYADAALTLCYDLELTPMQEKQRARWR